MYGIAIVYSCWGHVTTFLNGNVYGYQYLPSADLAAEMAWEPCTSQVRKLVLCLCRYLDKERKTSGEYWFSWGPRAEAEVNKKELLAFVAEVSIHLHCLPFHPASLYRLSW